MTSLRLFTVTGLILSLLSPSLANDASGWWNSSSGSKINLSSDRQRVTVTVHSQGKQWQYQGYWVVYGQSFAYGVKGQTYQAHFANGSQILVTTPSREVTVWSRTAVAKSQPKPQPKSNSSSIAGSWLSNVGSNVQVRRIGQDLYFDIVAKNGTNYHGTGRWTSAKNFEYTLAGHAKWGKARGTLMKNGRVVVVYGSHTTYWDRR